MDAIFEDSSLLGDNSDTVFGTVKMYQLANPKDEENFNIELTYNYIITIRHTEDTNAKELFTKAINKLTNKNKNQQNGSN